MRKRIVITMGDPAGCGPLITLKALAEFHRRDVEWFIVGDKKIAERFLIFKRLHKKITLIDTKTAGIKRIKPGLASSLGGRAALNYLRGALRFLEDENINVLVTAPLSKEAVQRHLPNFCGHTEFLAEYFGVRKVAMMMVAGTVRIALLTRHILLREVPEYITEKLVKDTLKVVYTFLRERCNIAKPRIAVASVNPHAGVSTFYGKEERIIKRALDASGLALGGPFPLDTLFLKEKLGAFDCVIVPYHDAAMIPFKLLYFSRGVNVTCGLPLLRTSPAHGVAFDLMRKGENPLHSSMLAAIKLAYSLSA